MEKIIIDEKETLKTYVKKVNKLKNYIDTLQSIGINMEEYRIALEELKSSVNKTILEDFNSYGKSHGNYCPKSKEFFKIRANKTFTEAIAKLEKMDNNILRNKYTEIINQTLAILKATRKSINSETEKSIIDHAYKLVYYTMALEIVNTNTTRILDAVKADPTNAKYISEILIEDLKDVDNKEIAQLVEALQKDETDPSNLLDKRLITMLTSVKRPESLKNIISQYIDYLNKMDQLCHREKETTKEIERKEENKETTEKMLKSSKQELKELHKRSIIPALILCLGIAGGAIFGTILENTLRSKHQSRNVTTTYESNTDSTYSRENTSDKQDTQTDYFTIIFFSFAGLAISLLPLNKYLNTAERFDSGDYLSILNLIDISETNQENLEKSIELLEEEYKKILSRKGRLAREINTGIPIVSMAFKANPTILEQVPDILDQAQEPGKSLIKTFGKTPKNDCQ